MFNKQPLKYSSIKQLFTQPNNIIIQAESDEKKCKNLISASSTIPYGLSKIYKMHVKASLLFSVIAMTEPPLFDTSQSNIYHKLR